MTDKEKDTVIETENTETQDGVEKAASPAVEAPEKSELELMIEKLDAEKDARLRTVAEYENFRKRTAKEREGILSEAFAMAVSAFLPVIDNLERACIFKDNPKGLAEGLELILKQIEDVKHKLNLTVIDPKGEKFDPERHNAVLHIEDQSLGENIVAEVLQKGYALEDRVIRFAMVKVAN